MKEAVTVRFAPHAQSGSFPVVQVWRENDQGEGAWAWVRTPGDFLSLTEEEWMDMRVLAAV